MADAGYRPAFNFQFAVDTTSNVIIGLDVVNAGTDGGQMLPMFEQIKKRYNMVPKRYLADGGFKSKTDVEQMTRDGCEVYMPVQEKTKGKKVKNAHEAKANESEEIAEWRLRMSREETKEIYKRRASSVELVNAHARNRGLYQILVRGLKKAKGIAAMFAAVHNMARSFAFGAV